MTKNLVYMGLHKKLIEQDTLSRDFGKINDYINLNSSNQKIRKQLLGIHKQLHTDKANLVNIHILDTGKNHDFKGLESLFYNFIKAGVKFNLDKNVLEKAETKFLMYKLMYITAENFTYSN